VRDGSPSQLQLTSFQPLLGARPLHGGAGSNPVQESHEPWPTAHIDLVNLRPIQDGVGISISDSERLTRQIGFIPKLAIQDVKTFRQVLDDNFACCGAGARVKERSEVRSSSFWA
jgi:hypothetical protein